VWVEIGVLQLLTTTPQRFNNPFWLLKIRGFRRDKYSSANSAARERNWVIKNGCGSYTGVKQRAVQ
jgi:hypothetical protein